MTWLKEVLGIYLLSFMLERVLGEPKRWEKRCVSCEGRDAMGKANRCNAAEGMKQEKQQEQKETQTSSGSSFETSNYLIRGNSAGGWVK